METTSVDVTTDYLDLSAALTLSANKQYYIQVRGTATVYFAERTSAPAAGDDIDGHVLHPGSEFYFTYGSLRPIVWANKAGRIVISQAS